jgi:hypothetical protein
VLWTPMLLCGGPCLPLAEFLSILDTGEIVAKHVELDPGDTVGFVLLSHKHVCPCVLAELSSVFPKWQLGQKPKGMSRMKHSRDKSTWRVFQRIAE